MKREIAIGALVGAAVLAIAAWLVLRQADPATTPATTAASGSAAGPAGARMAGALPGTLPASPDATTPAGAASVPGMGTLPPTSPNGVAGGVGSSTGSASAPWLENTTPTAAAPQPPPGVQIGRAGAPSIEDIQARLQQLAKSGQPTAREVDAVLADLQRNQGGNVVAGVDLQALRDNLARAERMQQLAQQMQTISAAPGPDTAARLQPLMDEIQRLQSGMRHSVQATVPAGAARP